MQTLKIVIGICAVFLAWIYIYRTNLIFKINAWMREYVFSDRHVLFSNRRMALLLFGLGVVSIFSGIRGLEEFRPIPPHVASTMLAQAEIDVRDKSYRQAVARCQQLVRSNPKNFKAWELLAISQWALGRKNLAYEAVQGLLANNTNYDMKNSPLIHIQKEKFPK